MPCKNYAGKKIQNEWNKIFISYEYIIKRSEISNIINMIDLET